MHEQNDYEIFDEGSVTQSTLSVSDTKGRASATKYQK